MRDDIFKKYRREQYEVRDDVGIVVIMDTIEGGHWTLVVLYLSSILFRVHKLVCGMKKH